MKRTLMYALTVLVIAGASAEAKKNSDSGKLNKEIKQVEAKTKEEWDKGKEKSKKEASKIKKEAAKAEAKTKKELEKDKEKSKREAHKQKGKKEKSRWKFWKK